MGARRFLTSMLAVLSVVLVVIYMRTGSLWSAAVHTAISAFLLQAGYVLCLVLMLLSARRSPVAGLAEAPVARQKIGLAMRVPSIVPSDLQSR